MPTPSTKPPCQWPDCDARSTALAFCGRDYARMKPFHADWRAASTDEERAAIVDRAYATWNMRPAKGEVPEAVSEPGMLTNELRGGAHPRMPQAKGRDEFPPPREGRVQKPVEVQDRVQVAVELPNPALSAAVAAALDEIALALGVRVEGDVAVIVEEIAALKEAGRRVTAVLEEQKERSTRLQVALEKLGTRADGAFTEATQMRVLLAVSPETTTDALLDLVNGDLEDTKREGVSSVVRQLATIFGDAQADLVGAAQLETYLDQVRAAVRVWHHAGTGKATHLSPEDLRARVRLLDEADELERRVAGLRSRALNSNASMEVAHG